MTTPSSAHPQSSFPEHQPPSPYYPQQQQAYYPPQPVFTGVAFTDPAGFGQPPYNPPVHAPTNQQPVWTHPVKRAPASVIVAVVAISVLIIVLSGIFVYYVASLGPLAIAISLVAALLPLAVVLAAVVWIDRWEPEPRLALFFAMLWGAAASVVIALAVGLGFEFASIMTTGGGVDEMMMATVQAPIVEEIAKSLGVLLIFFVARKHFDGPLDGLVYGAVVAAGFAFTENVLYFGAAIVNGGVTEFSATFVMRALMSPFAHVMFTALAGLLIGMGARRSSGAGVVCWFFVGLIPAIGLHALWNSALFQVSSLDGFVGYYLIVQVPLFVGWIALTLLVRRHEIKITEARLSEYAAAGWFTTAEVRMLASWNGRRQARSWAATLPGQKRHVMSQFTRDATRLAYTRQRIITGRNHLVHRRTESELLEAVARDRAALLAP